MPNSAGCTGPRPRPNSTNRRPTEHTQEFLLSFLQWLDADLAGLPDGYRDRLTRALGRYGVDSLTRSPVLESALMWMFRSFTRLTELSPVVIAILERRLTHRHELAEQTDRGMRSRLDRLAAATQGRQQTIADLARDVRFHYFDEPPIEAAAEALIEEMSEHIAHLAAASRRRQCIRAHATAGLVSTSACVRLCSTRGVSTTRQHRRRFDESLWRCYIRRFYRICDFGEITFHESQDFLYATTSYEDNDTTVVVIVGYVPLDALPTWSEALAPHLRSLGSETHVIADAVTWRTGAGLEIDRTAREVTDLADQSNFGRPLQRLDVTVSTSSGTSDERSRSQHITLTQNADGSFAEDPLFRNLHPMLAERLELWRLSNFNLVRRPSPEDVYVFDGVAKSNPRDHRLFAVGEVRELMAAHDPVTGEVTYPRLERIGLLALAAMRSELARYAIRDRPVANRLVLDIRAPWTLSMEETQQLAHRFTPLAGRVGLEKVVLKVSFPEDAPGGARDAVLHIEQAGHRTFVRRRPCRR